MGFLSRSQSIATSEVALGGLRIQNAGYGVAIPINYGKNRVRPTLIWYGNFKAIPHTTTQESGGGGKGGGGVESSNTTFTYTAGIIFSLGEGPAADIGKMWVGKQSYAAPADVGLSKFLGTYPQSPWGWLTSYAPGQALGYQGIVYVAASDYAVDANASLGNHTFEVSGRLKDIYNDDVNPKDIIVDFLTNVNYGVPGFSSSRIGDLTQLSNYCDAAGVRISPSVDTQRPAHEWLTEFAQVANSAPIWSEGKLKILPYCDEVVNGSVTYTPDTTPAYDLTDDDYITSGDDPPIVATRKKQTTAFNIVQVEYLDRANDYNIAIAEVKDQASIEAYGELPLPILRLHGITMNAVAMQIAQAILQRVCYVRKEYKFKLSLKYSRLEPMDGLTLTDARMGMNLFPVRVTEVSEDGDEVLAITAEERDLGISSANTYDAQGGSGYAPDHSIVPGDMNPPDVFIAPANLTVSGYEVWAAISNADPNYGGCHIWASYDNATYQKIGTLIGNSRQGFITAALPAGADPDTVNTLAVDLTESAGALDTANQPAVDAFDTLCLVGNEFVAYRDSALTAASKYDLTYLRRGVYGSTQGAAINARFVRCDQALFKHAFDSALWGFTLYFKFVGFNKFGSGLQDIAALTPVTVVLSGSLTRPAPPSNFYIGQSEALVSFSWTPSPDRQVRWNEIRYVLQGAPVRWQDGIVLNGAAAGAAFVSSQVVPGAWSFMLAAKDAGGNFSTPVTRDFTVANANTVLHATQEAAPGDTAGSTLTNMVKHWTGKIFPRSQNLADADAWDTFDVFVPNPYADCSYEPAEIDLGSDQTVRAWAALWADMMPDTTLGFAQPQLQLDYKLAAGAYGGFQAWSINTLTARYVKMKFTLNTAQGTPVIRLFNPTIDA